ncbi:thioredoxin family protein [Moraxella nasovis]|uniref:DUF255 domain-containing protein n=1 Tax=Moraxella nasovis TaxID=2904121 RepID=UPI001F61731A|nr:DUF255 domain-containing protein [Moraxella nasovis]UNU74183.1 thioredoxin family protein [Moraxella nasovis]
MKKLPYVGLLFGLAISACSFADTTAPTIKPIEHFPKTPDVNCRDGNAKLHDECGDQVLIIKNAIATAQSQNKNVLMIYGGEWCIWCHVLDRYFNGKIQTHDYVWRDSNGDLSQWVMNENITQNDIDNAIKLNHYVADNFVIAHIDGDYANGEQALDYVNFTDEIVVYPTIMVLNKQGKYAHHMPPTSFIDGLQIREVDGQPYRGYDRAILLQELQKLHGMAK